MKIKAYTMTPKDITETGNQMKEAFLEQMLKEGHISKEQADKMNGYCFVVAEKTFFGSIWDKLLWKNDPEATKIVVVKILPEPEEEEKK